MSTYEQTVDPQRIIVKVLFDILIPLHIQSHASHEQVIDAYYTRKYSHAISFFSYKNYSI